MVNLRGVQTQLTTYLLVGIILAWDVVNIKIIVNPKHILPPAMDQGKCIGSKILSRLRRSCIRVKVRERSPKTMETLPEWELLLELFWKKGLE